MKMVLLAIETTGSICSVALFANGKIAEKQSDTVNSHSKELHLLIDELMKAEQVIYSELSAVVFSKGPGSYTGLRIGSSAAKGLCMALKTPLIAIASHESMLNAKELNLSQFDIVFCATDARRDEVYLTIFDNKKHILEPTAAIILEDTNPTTAYSGKKILIIGSGAHKFERFNNPNIKIINDDNLKAKNLIELAIVRFDNKNFEDIHQFEPFYLKQFYTTQKPLSF